MTENMDRENTMFEVEDTIDKIKFLVDDFKEQYGFNSTEEMDEKKSLFTARLTIIGISIVSIFMARNPNSSVFGIVSFAWAGFGASFGAVMLCALFWRRSTLAGALSGMVAGGVMVFVWKYLVRPLGGALDIYELLPAFLVSLAVIIIVSLLTNKPSDEVLAEFDKAAGK